MIDFEDGCRLRLIDFDKSYQTIKVRNKDNSLQEVVLNKSPKDILVNIAKHDTSFDEEKLASLGDFKQEISYLRSKVINVLIHECFAIFESEYENIMTGKFDKALLDCLPNSEIKESLQCRFRAIVSPPFCFLFSPLFRIKLSPLQIAVIPAEGFTLCGER